MVVPKYASLALLVTALASPARAETPSSEAAVETRREQAKVQFQRGSELYEAGEYRKSVEAFMEADRLAPSAPLSFNIARAYERLNDPSGALRWYRDYLRRNPQAPNAAEVRSRIGTLSAKLAQAGVQQLSVVSMPVGATVVVDGRAVGVTPFTGDLPLGAHRVGLDLAGHRSQTHDVRLGRNAPTDLSADLEPAPQPLVVGTGATDRNGGSRFGVVPWVVAGGGLAALGGALGFELSRRSHENTAESNPDQPTFQAEIDAMQRDKTTARVLAGVGGALLVTGTVMLFVNHPKPATTTPQVGLGCSFAGCGASAKGSF